MDTATVDAVAALRPVRPDGDAPMIRGRLVVQVIDDPSHAAALVPEWRELAAAAGASPFTGPDYGLLWWRHRGRGRLQLVSVRYDGQLVALAPLHVRPLSGLQVVRWLGHGLGTVAELVVRPGFGAAASAVWTHLAQQPRVLLDLVEYRDDGAGLAQLRRHRELTTSVTLRDVCPIIELEGLPSGRAVIDRLPRRHGLRRSLQRAERRLDAERRTFTVDVATEVEGLRVLLPEVEAVVDAAEEHLPRLNPLRPPWRAFHVELLEALLRRGECKVFLARIDGRAAAVEVTVEDPRTTAHWVSRFDPRFADFSPGHQLVRVVIDDALRRGARRCDLLIGDGPHKLPLATASYDTLTVHAAPSALIARRAVLRASVAARTRVARAVHARLQSRSW